MSRGAARVAHALCMAALLAGAAHAHEVRPAFLQIREVSHEVYDVVWKTPAQGNLRLALDVVLPAACTDVVPARAVLVDGAVVERRRTAWAGGLAVREVGVSRL